MKTSGVKVKICGLTRSEDVSCALDLNPWAVGFIFYEKSPRYVQPRAVAEFLAPLAERPILKVGVFVNASLEEIVEVVGQSKVTGVQLHGDETPAFCLSVKRALPHVALIKAVRPQIMAEIDELKNFKGCDFLLVDGFSPKARGGTGTLARWDLAREYVRQCAQQSEIAPLLLSGGLNEDNLEEAVNAVKPFAVDLASSLEV